MIPQANGVDRVCVRLRHAATAAALALATTASPAAESALSAPLCGIVKKLLPEVRTYKPEGARAQLVMAVGEKFDYDGIKLRQVKAEIGPWVHDWPDDGTPGPNYEWRARAGAWV